MLELPKKRPLSPQEVGQLRSNWLGGDQKALEQICLANYRLVMSQVKRYIGRSQWLTPEDLFICGVLGLIDAIRNFDASRGCRLSTYAVPWIRQAISREIDNKGTVIHVPVHRREYARHIQSNWELATPEERQKASDILEVMNSMSLEYGMEIGLPLQDRLKRKEIDPLEVYLEKEKSQEIMKVFSRLTEREKLVLNLHYGQEFSLNAIGKLLNLSRERVRQIKEGAKNKIKKDDLF